ncbi:MAG: hypothetical protein JW751_32395 [Polyangiaceae bacterium]|nr:hypothetical protein [Polyangiaceae bacterium]
MQIRDSGWLVLVGVLGATGPACGPERAPAIDLAAAGTTNHGGALPPLGGYQPGGNGGAAAVADPGGIGGRAAEAGAAGEAVALGGSSGAAGRLGTGSGGAAGAAGAVICGNATLDPGEECDGALLGEATCESQGFEAGTLACASCAFDRSGCSGTERCYDGRDNDGDGDPDCSDDDCADPCADSCATPPVLNDPDTVAGDTSGHANLLDASCGAGEGSSGSEVVYRFVAGATGIVEVRVTSSSAELAVAIQQGCDRAATELGCAYGAVASATVTSGDELFVLVDGVSAADAGPFELAIETRTIACGDGALDLGEECDDGGEEPGDGCADDCAVESSEGRQNDTAHQADTLETPYYGRIAPGGDEDWIRVDVPDGGTVLAETRGFLADDCEAGRLDTFLELYDEEDPATLVEENDDVDTTCAVLEATGLAAGTYLLRVYAATTNTPAFPYVLDVVVN